jgi:hypothetical protein
VSRAPREKRGEKRGGEKRGKEREKERRGDRGTSIRTYEHTCARRRDGRRRAGAGPSLSLSLSLSLSATRFLLPSSLARLVTPTTSTLVQDNTRLILPLVFHLAPTHLSRGTQRQIHSSVQGPPGSETPTVGAPVRGLLRVNEHFPVEFQMGRLQQPLQPGTMLRFGSLKFMSLDGSYDMVLLPPQHDDNDSQRLARRRRPP